MTAVCQLLASAVTHEDRRGEGLSETCVGGAKFYQCCCNSHWPPMELNKGHSLVKGPLFEKKFMSVNSPCDCECGRESTSLQFENWSLIEANNVL